MICETQQTRDLGTRTVREIRLVSLFTLFTSIGRFSVAGLCDYLNRKKTRLSHSRSKEEDLLTLSWCSESSPATLGVRGFSLLLLERLKKNTQDETLIYVARVEYSSSSACGALDLCRMASSKRIYTASNLSGATQTAATAAMVGREALTRHYL